MPKSVLLDAGPLVAYLREVETNHAWAVEQFQNTEAAANNLISLGIGG